MTQLRGEIERLEEQLTQETHLKVLLINNKIIIVNLILIIIIRRKQRQSVLVKMN